MNYSLKIQLAMRRLVPPCSFWFMESPCIDFLKISKPFWVYKANNRMARTGGSLFCQSMAIWALISDLSSRNKVLHLKPSSPIQVREKICPILQIEVSCKLLRRSYIETGFMSLRFSFLHNLDASFLSVVQARDLMSTRSVLDICFRMSWSIVHSYLSFSLLAAKEARWLS